MKTRVRGLIKFAGSGLVFSMVLYYIYLQERAKNSIASNPFALIGMCAPGGVALAGLVELITGISFMDLSKAWDRLKGWQRGMLSLLIVSLVFGLFFGGLLLYGYLNR